MDLDARVTAALIAGIAGFLGAVIAATISIWNRRKTDQQQRELQAHRARLDQLDRVHSRRVEQIEILYAGIEAATHVLLSDELPDPNEALLGAEELQTARRLHAGARIYLDDDVDRLCLDLLEELQRAWSARWEHHEWGFAPKIPEEVLAELRRYPEVASAGQALRDRLRVQLRAALNGKRHTSDQ